MYARLYEILDEKQSINSKLISGEITLEEYYAKIDILQKESEKIKLEMEQTRPKKFDMSEMTSRGRIPYFTDEEIMAQTRDLKNAFKQINLIEVYKRFYNSDKISFLKDLNKLIATFPMIENVNSQLLSAKNEAYFSPSNITNIIENLPEHKRYYIDALMTGDKSKIETAEKFILAKEKQRLLKLHLPQVDFIDKLEEISGIRIYPILRDIKDPKYFTQMRKSLANDLIEIEQEWGIRKKHKPLRSELPKQKKQNVFVDNGVNDDITEQKINSSAIEKQTSKIVGNKVSTSKSKNALSSALPIINRLFKQLGELINKNLDKFNNSKTGKVFNYGMLAKDIYFIINLADKITKQINAGEEVFIHYGDDYWSGGWPKY